MLWDCGIGTNENDEVNNKEDQQDILKSEQNSQGHRALIFAQVKQNQIWILELWIMNYELWIMNYELWIMNYELWI